MTDRFVLTKNGTVVFDSGPTDQAPPAPSGPSASSSTQQHLEWAQVGMIVDVRYQPGGVVSFSYDVPPFYSGSITCEMVPRDNGAPDYVGELHMWHSETPAGPAIAGTEYIGPWMANGVLPAPAFSPPTPGRQYFFNVVMNVSGVYGVQQQHQ